MITTNESNFNSSMIEKCFYDFTKNKLKVKFNGGQVYEYENVEPAVYEAFCQAESTGRYFIENIKNKYDFTQLITG
jgi:lysyl-tRNA synthetase class 2